MPVVFVNGLFVLGFKEEEGMRALVEAEMATSRRMIGEGTPRAALYETFMAGAVRERGAVAEATSKDQNAQSLAAERKAERAPQKLTAPDGSQRYAVPVGEEGVPFEGPADAAVVVVEFVDYQCPFCRKAHEEVLAPLRERYRGKVRFEARQLPLEIHASAEPAARAALAAGNQGKYWEFQDRVFSLSEPFSHAGFVAHAKALGLDVERFERDFTANETRARVAADMALARVLGVSATPVFFVNGRYVSGARSLATYEELVIEELGRADQLEQAGTAKAELHAALMQGALGPDRFPNATN